MGANREGSWPGGYLRRDAAGRTTYWIRRKVGGVRYEISTRCTQLRPALAELEKFERDPAGYQPGGVTDAPVFLDAELVADFIAWSKARETSIDWRKRQRFYLAWWSAQLARRDLRRVDLRAHLLPPLEKVAGRRQRIAVLKSLYAWLRTVKHSIEAGEDPTLHALVAEQAKPEQWSRAKAVPRDVFAKVLAKVKEPYRDPLELLSVTGWHVSELVRFARDGRLETYFGPQLADVQERIAGVALVPLHKNGAPHRTALLAPHLEVAKRVLGRRDASRANNPRAGVSAARLHAALRAACREVEVEPFGPGQLRHSVATWAVEEGAPVEAVASFLGHRSLATTKRFYATHAVPARPVTRRPA